MTAFIQPSGVPQKEANVGLPRINPPTSIPMASNDAQGISSEPTSPRRSPAVVAVASISTPGILSSIHGMKPTRRLSFDEYSLRKNASPLKRSLSETALNDCRRPNKPVIENRMGYALQNKALNRFIDELKALNRAFKNRSRNTWYCETQTGLTCGMAVINAFFQYQILNIRELQNLLFNNYKEFMPDLNEHELRNFFHENIQLNGIDADAVVSIVNSLILRKSESSPDELQKLGWNKCQMNLLHVVNDNHRAQFVSKLVEKLKQTMKDFSHDNASYWPIIAIYGDNPRTMGHFVTFVFEYGNRPTPLDSGAWFELESARIHHTGMHQVNTKLSWLEFQERIESSQIKAMMLPSVLAEQVKKLS